MIFFALFTLPSQLEPISATITAFINTRIYSQDLFFNKHQKMMK